MSASNNKSWVPLGTPFSYIRANARNREIHIQRDMFSIAIQVGKTRTQPYPESEIMNKVINRTHPESEWYGFWCPVCEQIRDKPAALSPWLSPQGVLVCVYVLCGQCTDSMEGAPWRLRIKLIDKVERNLLNRYPQLQTQLPRGYIPASDCE
jgi:hypothetical protein